MPLCASQLPEWLAATAVWGSLDPPSDPYVEGC